MFNILKKIIPKKIFIYFQPMYHGVLAFLSALFYMFPSRKIKVIGITGTKGKSSTSEILYHIFKEAGFKTALSNTIRFIDGKTEKRNLYKMTMPGRFFIQRFLKEAIKNDCEVAIIEISSEASKQFRNKYIFLDALIFTNLAKEHIESHGSYEKYIEAKVNIAREMEKKGLMDIFNKKQPVIIVNKDDRESFRFLKLNIPNKISYSPDDFIGVKTNHNSSSFQLNKSVIHTKIGGIFNIYNIAGAVACAKYFKITDENIKKGLEKIEVIKGRMERIDVNENFSIVVDYAHTPDSLEAIYKAHSDLKKVCILGNTGGGRDVWKRPEMAKIADTYCDHIILANEDPYDEDPMQIINDMKVAIKNKNLEIILDRREAIKKGIAVSKKISTENKVALLITGKGTDPYIMGKDGQKEKWDDLSVVKEELEK